MIAAGDVVRCSSAGRLFHAVVREVRGARITVTPIEREISARAVRVEDIVDHWAHQPKAEPPVAPGQRTLADLWDR